jgi:hypothetical protein
MLIFAMMAVIRHKANQQQKPKATPEKAAVAHPLVHPGNQTYRSAPRAKANKPSQHYRMVALATSPPSRLKICTPKIKIITVMLTAPP